MKKMLKKILALVMGVMVLSSSYSFAYFEHLCTLSKDKTYTFDLASCFSDSEELEDVEIPEIPEGQTILKKGTCCEIDFQVKDGHNLVQEVVSLDFTPIFGITPIKPNLDLLLAEYKSKGFTFFTGKSQRPSHPYPIFILNQQFII